jgi:hypothetical protein
MVDLMFGAQSGPRLEVSDLLPAVQSRENVTYAKEIDFYAKKFNGLEIMQIWVH